MNILNMARHGLNNFEQIALIGVLLIAIIALLYAWFLRKDVLKKDTGSKKMLDVWDPIRIGAESYLKRQAKTIIPIVGVLTIALFLSVYVVPPTQEALSEFPQNAKIIIAIGRAVAFILGAGFSLVVGQLGMRMAIQASIRSAAAARKGILNESMSIAYHAGTITGMLTDGLGLLGGTVIFIIFGKASPDVLLGFGFGGTLLALFMRVGGGIYTKAADVGADLVGKVEKDIPEDDPRNAAVVADLVGDNVGDCAGMAADIFESYEVTIVAALTLGIALVAADPAHSIKWIVFPLIIRGIGVISSILGTIMVPVWNNTKIAFLKANDAEQSMFRSYTVSSIFTIICSFVVAIQYANDWKMGALIAIGVGVAVAFNPLTSYFTSTKQAPVKEIVNSTKTGSATTILSGLSLGMESSVWAVLVICVAFALSLAFYSAQGTLYVLYAIAMVGIGMLSQTGNNVAMDSFGPISDNANGIGEMAWHDQKDAETLKARQILADLDSVGNTTKAITKGVAIASAVIAAVSLFGSFLTDIGRVQTNLGLPVDIAIRISDPKVFIGFLIGGALPWLFSSLSIRAVSRAAEMVVDVVRQQFKRPGIMEGKVAPDYAQVVGISTTSAQKELIPLATIAILTPLVVGMVLQVEALGGFLAGVILSGQMLAVFMSNAGGAWDNAKKAIEDEPRNLAANTGKGSERHKAGVVGDTVGDPLKDTAGPALNPMIKVVNQVSLLAAPIIVQYQHLNLGGWIILAVLMLGVIFSLRQSKKQIPELATETH